MSRPGPGRGSGPRRSRGVVALLLFASLTVMTLDVKGGEDSPIAPVRQAIGTVLGPAESATVTVARPFRDISDALKTNKSLRREVASLTAKNAELRAKVDTQPLDERRLQELDSLVRTAHDTGYSMVAARVVALGSAQSFSRTATIDAGTSSGVRPDLTVVNGDGLVGRVIRATAYSATVLLIADQDSTVGGRLGSSLEIGFVKGRGDLGGRGMLDLDLVDNTVSPAKGDAVVTWGSPDGVPFVAGIPIGTVTRVFSTPRDLSQRAVIRPYVDFSSLDLVGVVVPHGTKGDRQLITGAKR